MASAIQISSVKYENFLFSKKALFLKTMNFLPQLQPFVEASISCKEDMEVIIEMSSAKSND